MGAYNFDEIKEIWKNYARKIVENGVFIGHDSNWDLWVYKDVVYSIPLAGTGADCSQWCRISELRGHLIRLKRTCGFQIENANFVFLSKYGITEN